MKVNPETIPAQTGTTYPEPFRLVVEGRSRKKIGEAAGLKNFGVNLTTLEPGAQSALRHWHSAQDEFVYVVQGKLTLITNEGEQTLTAGEMAGFAAGVANGHHLVNRSEQSAVYLEVGDRTSPDRADYPDEDLVCVPTADGIRQFEYKSGQPYSSMV